MTSTDGPRIIATAAELSTAAASVAPTAPVYLGHDEIEPGADPDDQDTWVVLAEATAVPAGPDGAPARAGGQPIAMHEVTGEDGEVQRHLASTTVLTLRARHLAQAGVIGPAAMPADPELRRQDAADDPDDDMSRYLMELLEAGNALRDELLEPYSDKLRPVIQRRLQQAAASLDTAAGLINEATVYGRSCELARTDLVDDDQPCTPACLNDIYVFLPKEGFDEAGCPQHAAAALALDPEAVITRITDTARTTLTELLPPGTNLPLQEPE